MAPPPIIAPRGITLLQEKRDKKLGCNFIIIPVKIADRAVLDEGLLLRIILHQCPDFKPAYCYCYHWLVRHTEETALNFLFQAKLDIS